MVIWTCPQCGDNMHSQTIYDGFIVCHVCHEIFQNPCYQKKEQLMITTARIKVNEYKKDPLQCIEQIEFCEYECEGGLLKNNVAWQAIKELLTGKEDEHI